MDNDAPKRCAQPQPGKLRVKALSLRHLATATTKHGSLADLFDYLRDPPVDLLQTAKGDDIAEGRYESAEEFYPSRGLWPSHDMSDLYYKAGMVAQLGLSAHLLKAGFPDRWCAVQIGYRVAHSLAYANATGLDHYCPRMARLAAVLTPYWRWNMTSRHHYGQPDDPGFTVEEVCSLLRVLLAKVRMTTGFKLIDNDLAP